MQYKAIGLMSGTSMDGVDAAYIETDGVTVKAHQKAITISYPEPFKQRLHQSMHHGADVDIMALEDELTHYHIQAIQQLVKELNISCDSVDVIGFPGQTIRHIPEKGQTWQIGNPAKLARATGINVVADFRRCDMASGGQGAPLVPVYHAALCRGLTQQRVAVVNIGGVANVTYCDLSTTPETIIAFDTGPGNALIDDLMYRQTGKRFDNNGEIAAKGTVQHGLLKTLLDHEYYKRPYPKSLDRHAFPIQGQLNSLSFEDQIATLTALTAYSIHLAHRLLPLLPERWLLCGGGRHNQTLLQHLRLLLKEPVDLCEVVGWDGDALEAQAFAFLAVRCLENLPIAYSTTTGANACLPAGAVYRVSR